MFKLLKFLKKSVVALIFVTILMVLQAACDLSLPTYTSDIVNVGITNSGIEYNVPTVIRKSQFDKVVMFMTEEERELVVPHYSLIDQTTLSEKEWSDFLKKYPLATSEALYQWDGEDVEELNEALKIPLLMLYGMENNMGEGSQNTAQPSGQASTDPAAMLAAVREQVSQMPDMIVSGTAISYVRSEYEAIGLNLSKMQVNYILITGAKMIGLAFAAMAAAILVTYLSSRIAARMGRDLRSGVFHKVLSFSNNEMDKFSTASLITRSTNDIQQVQMMLVMLIRIVIYSPILAIGGIVKVVNTNNSMSWILIVGVGAIFVLIGTLFIVAMPKFKLMQKLIDRINLITREILTGLPVIRAFSTVKHEEERFDKANVDITKNSLFVNRVMTFMFPALMLIMNLVSILIVWVGADRINNGSMQVGDMIAFIQYTMQIIISFLMFTMISIMLPRASVSATRIDEILSTETSIKDPEQEAPMDLSKKGLLEFRHVHFRYPNAEEDVLYDISFAAKPGETTAIIGSTGSGKSTLINLIPRFYDVTEGSILLNGTDITKIKQKTLRSKIGFVPQKGVLFTGTIESNILFGASDAGEEIMKKAARIAQASEFIESKPEGYEAAISEGGTNVSGGQKQRLSIARAIAKNPDVYIFDDSFSALDYKTDSVLRKAIKEEISDSTVLIVAQRISTIMNAEQIIVLDDGRIVGKGTHKELLKNCEVYQQIATSQLSKEELDYE